MHVFHVIKKSEYPADLIAPKDGLDRYINFYYVQTIEDWTKWFQDPSASPYTDIYYRAIECEQSHFGDSEDAKKLFQSWQGFLLICPDIYNQTHFHLSGKLGDNKTTHLSFRVERCIDNDHEYTGNNFCHPNETIDEYVHDMQV